MSLLVQLHIVCLMSFVPIDNGEREREFFVTSGERKAVRHEDGEQKRVEAKGFECGMMLLGGRIK